MSKRYAASYQPKPAAQDSAHPGGRKERALTVGELSRRITQLLEGQIGRVHVEGEISNLRVAASGHAYFLLKDSEAAVNAVCFRSAVQSLRVALADGKKVEVSGRVTAYAARSEYQIIVDSAREAGVGELMQRFLELRDRLKGEGLFDASRKKPLPKLPRTIGVVTSPTGAAIRDVLHVLHRRAGGLRIFVFACSVQGQAAPGEIIRAIQRAERHGECEALIIGRGGGSIEDLWAFNDERVVRALAACKIPTISAVGHETDTTLADFAADLRAPTPSAAAEIVTANYEALARAVTSLHRALDRAMRAMLGSKGAAMRELARSWGMRRPIERLERAMQRLDDLAQRLERAPARRLGSARTRLDGLAMRLAAARPAARWLPRIERAKADAAQWDSRLHRAMAARLREHRLRLRGAEGRLGSLGPPAVLRRGYSFITTLNERTIVTGPDQAKPGQTLRVHSAGGKWRVAALPNVDELFDGSS